MSPHDPELPEINGTNQSTSSDDDGAVKESTIRKMTRLAMEYGAVNLSQGFPNEPPPRSVRLALALGVLTGQAVVLPNKEEAQSEDDLIKSLLQACSLEDTITRMVSPSSEDIEVSDIVNQYSPPMGRPDVRNAIVDHYRRIYNYCEINADEHVTLTLGATEAVASALRTLGKPGDKIVIFEPFHELYANQCQIFYLKPSFVTLRPTTTSQQQTWTFDREEFVSAVQGAKAILLNSPHNPTGKVFTHEELEFIVNACLEHECYIITDEIYEHMCYDKKIRPHILLPHAFPQIRDRVLVCNSIGKSASATGWRLGWCLHPSHLCATYRGIHDQLAVMAPHPMQQASLTYFSLPKSYFEVDLATRYLDRVNGLSQTLQEVGFGVVAPESAYYLFVTFQSVPALKDKTPSEAALYLLKEVGVACVPGDNFYGKDVVEASQYLRFAACRSTSDLEQARVRLLQLTKSP